eukprot:NODE_444_length_8544_cov_0.465127.p5 type:complete len:193 gc:universal NODE_444_length_8544_cov_0.465127:1862-2440(+)
MLPEDSYRSSPTWEYPNHSDNRNKLRVDTSFVPVYSNYQEPNSADPYVSTFQQQQSSMTYDAPMSAPPVDIHFDYYNFYQQSYPLESPHIMHSQSPQMHTSNIHSPQITPSSPMLSPQHSLDYRSPQIPIPAQKKLSKQQQVQMILEKINFEDITVSELKDILRTCGLSATGKKHILVDRVKSQRRKVLGDE